MLDQYGPPGRPHIIRWDGAHTATIATEDGMPIARLSVPPGGEPDVTILREPSSAEDREQLFRALVWAAEEHERDKWLAITRENEAGFSDEKASQ